MSKDINDALSNVERLMDKVYLEDKVDRLFYKWSPVIILICIALIAKQMVVNRSISCYTPITIGDEKAMMSYVNQYVWVHMKTSKLPEQGIEATTLQTKDPEEKYSVDYYYWIYFILSLQALLLYIPHSIWTYFCCESSGRDLMDLMNQANKLSSSKNPTDTKELGRNIIDIIRDNRDAKWKCCGSRFGLLKTLRRNKLRCLYMILMVVNFGISVSQLVLMMRVFGYSSPWSYFSDVFGAIINMGFMRESERFPRKVEVQYSGIQLAGGTHTFVAQCVLPVNMVCEKIVVVLSIWFMFLSVIQLFKLVYWFVRSIIMKRDQTFVSKMLKMKNVDLYLNKGNIKNFKNNFLNNDIMYLIRMIGYNVDNHVASTVTKELYDMYDHESVRPTDII